MQKLYIPRKKYIQVIEEIANCPDCNELLVAEKSTVLLYGKSDVDEGEFMSNLPGSHFCPNCPVVVFEKETIERAITLGLRIKKSFSYDILGFADLDAVPKEKRHLQLGIDENPIPLVAFLPNSDVKSKIMKPKTTNKNKFGKKVSRNEPCPCGSGKKYKRCCM